MVVQICPAFMQFQNDVALESMNIVKVTEEPKMWQKSRHTRVIAILWLQNIFLGVCCKKPLLCTHIVVNFL